MNIFDKLAASDLATKQYVMIGFLALFVIIALVCILRVVLGYLKESKANKASLPSLVDVGMEEEVQELDEDSTSNGVSAFDFDVEEEEGFRIDDHSANSILTEANRENGKVAKPKTSGFKLFKK